MRRGFLNSKKVKDQPLYDKGKLTVTTPPKDLEPASDTAAISRKFFDLRFLGGSESLVCDTFRSKGTIRTCGWYQ